MGGEASGSINGPIKKGLNFFFLEHAGELRIIILIRKKDTRSN
jgi:hypothetical protein